MRRYDIVNPLSLFTDLDQSFGHFFNHGHRRVSNNLNPLTDVQETPEYFHMSLDIPGVLKDDLKVELKESTLHIKGERRSKFKNEHNEFESLGSFERSFTGGQTSVKKAVGQF